MKGNDSMQNISLIRRHCADPLNEEIQASILNNIESMAASLIDNLNQFTPEERMQIYGDLTPIYGSFGKRVFDNWIEVETDSRCKKLASLIKHRFAANRN
ncbi:MAG: hypothetical protein JWN25_2635 [Verrucomicrobiales bacterium]|nr:hypothetical protein [Verrucomicrobiales bacterium]